VKCTQILPSAIVYCESRDYFCANTNQSNHTTKDLRGGDVAATLICVAALIEDIVQENFFRSSPL
jgi:hypothetical protein